MPAPKRPSPIKSIPDPWSRMDSLLQQTAEPVGPEWFTVREFRDRYPDRVRTIAMAGNLLNKLHGEKKLERWKGALAASGKVSCKYRLIDS